MNFDFINNQICPFCQEKIKPNNDFDVFWAQNHKYCPNDHIKVMYDGNGKWRLIRFQLFDLIKQNVVVWSDDNECRIENAEIYLSFNPFDYSFEELAAKIKLYLTFS